MRVKIREITATELRDALIKEGKSKELPSIHDNWKFNFASLLKKLSDAKAYLLVRADSLNVIEGCMIFQ